MLRTSECVPGLSTGIEQCVTAAVAVQDGWTFLDVRPPHEIAKVHPLQAGWWRVHGTRWHLLLDPVCAGSASRVQR